MTFNRFWAILSDGGVSAKGDQYKVTDDGRLHILSPRNKNRRYHIRQETVRRYFTQDIPHMTPQEFRRNRSAYFYNIYIFIMQRGE
jgi:hypothetical protein